MKLLRISRPNIRWQENSIPIPPNSTLSVSSTLGFAGFAQRSITTTTKRLISSTRPRMADYNKWTKDDLIARVKQLENEAKTQGAGSSLPAKHPDPEASPRPDEPAKKKPKKKGKGGMDPNKYATRFIALKFAYLGKNYNGFEYQSSGLLPTIEEELWKALVKACLIFPNPEKPNEVDWNCCGYSKCGRTDRGVSAFGQVVALRVRSNKLAKRKNQQQQQQAMGVTGKGGSGEDAQMGGTPSAAEETKAEEKQVEEEEVDDDDEPLPVEQEIQYCRVLNRILPPDIKIYAWCPNPGPDFSARFSCRERQYRYFFTQPAFQPLPDFLEPDTGAGAGAGKPTPPDSRPKPKDGWLDIEAMRQAASHFQGLHDFRNFCKVDASKQITNFARRVYEADIVEVDGADSSVPYLSGAQFRDPNHAVGGAAYPKVYYFHVRGSAFLWHQIRCMVAVLFLVGQGLEPPSVVADLLDVARHPRRPGYVLAEDTPLVLWDCVFGRENEDGAADEVDWLYVGHDSPLSLHGGWGVANELWEYWREKKMDEILANRLLDWVATKTGVDRVPSAADGAAAAAAAVQGKTKVGTSTRVYEGGHGPRYIGTYVPVLKKDLLQSPEDLNDRWAQRKGFKNAEEMRAVGNWRDAIKEKKNGGGEGEGAGGDE